MSYQSRAYDNEHGDPVVALVATGTHDVSRLVNLLNGATPNSEQRELAATVLRQVRRHNAGRAALRLLRDHGGPDFTDESATSEHFDPDDAKAYRFLADKVIEWFNPPDGEEAEESILADAVMAAGKFIEAQPCTCEDGAATFDVDPCERCQVLGRGADAEIER